MSHLTLRRAKGLIALALALSATPALAQLADVPAGAKRVQLNDAIRANQFTWLSDAPMEKIKGTAPGVSGTFTVDPAKLSEIKGKLTVPVKQMKSGNSLRDNHLKGKDWLDAGAHPEISFTIAKVTVRSVKGDEAELVAEGAFSLHGVSKTMQIPVTVKWKRASDKTAKVPGDWVKFTTKFEVKLADFAIKGKSGVVGNKVGERIAVEGTLYGHTVQ